MVVTYRCRNCQTLYRIKDRKAAMDNLKAMEKCPREWCGGDATLYEHGQMSSSKPGITLTTKEFIEAKNGLGLPDEQKCSPEELKKLLIGRKIIDFEIGPHPTNPKRSLIRQVIVEGESKPFRLFLGVSNHGVSAYKVTDDG